jgi:hypothetical protein
MSAVVLGAGFQWFGHRFPGRVATFVVAAFTLLPIPVYYAAPLFAGKMAVPMSTKRDLPYRDQYKWFLSPWKTGYTGTQRFADEVLAEVDPNAVVFGDASTVFALLLTRPLYVVSPLPGYCPEHILRDYDFEKAGHLWKVKRPAPAGGATTEPGP